LIYWSSRVRKNIYRTGSKGPRIQGFECLLLKISFDRLNPGPLESLNPKEYIVNEQIFREYDIRGVVGVDLTPEVV